MHLAQSQGTDCKGLEPLWLDVSDQHVAHYRVIRIIQMTDSLLGSELRYDIDCSCGMVQKNIFDCSNRSRILNSEASD